MEIGNMKTFLFNNSWVLRNFKAGTAIVGLALWAWAMPASAADAKPTAAEISKARAQCAAEKRKVKAMESADPDNPQLSAARLTWAQACGHAQDLISAASGAPPPAPVPAADPNAPQ
jgi:hypothetical protein